MRFLSLGVTPEQVATVQTVSGTGALRVASEFLSRFLPFSPRPSVYVSDPTYVNHYPVFERTGFEVRCAATAELYIDAC